MENNNRFRPPVARQEQRQVFSDRTPILPNSATPSVVPNPHLPIPADKTLSYTKFTELTLDFSLHMPKFCKTVLKKICKFGSIPKRPLETLIAIYLGASRRRRYSALALAILILVTTIIPMFDGMIEHKTYALSPGEESVLSPASESMAKDIKLDGKNKTYMFNQDYQPNQAQMEVKAGGALVKAEISQDPTKGVKVTDPVNSIDFTIKPLFKLGSGKQQQNRIVFPAFNGGGHLVYTAQAVGIKQDVTLDHYIGDNLKYAYQMELGDQFEAKLSGDGSVGIYGSSLPINGNVSTGSDKDKALLQKARQKAKKDKLLFNIPAPIIKETGEKVSSVKAKFILKKNKLIVNVTNLKPASYPLTIDPTVTALSATGFYFDANLETNVNVNATNNLLERAPLTGGNLLAWNAGNSTSSSHFMGSAAVYASTLYIIGGTSGTNSALLTNGTYNVEQAKINSNGSVGIFSAGNRTGLDANGVARFQLLAYNGYLYIINGASSSTSGSSVNSNIYYTRVTSESYNAFSNGAQLVDWTTESINVPASARHDYAAAVHNGVLYIAGGRTGSSYTSGLLTDVSYSTILPSGRPGAWTSSVSLPAARFGMDMQAYNGHLYIIGGNLGGGVSGGTLTASSLNSSINPNTGAIADVTWKTGSSLVNSTGATSQAMENLGSGYTMIYNGYLYATGGCTAVNANQACTAVASYAQLAQVNADGSLGTFFPNDFPSTGTSSLQRTATPTVGYNGVLYSVAGCSAMNAGAITCATSSLASNYSSVNPTVGDISNNRTPTSLPVALYGHSTVVLNGYLYVVGGCTTLSCTGTRTENYTTYYSLIGADGSLNAFGNNTLATDATALGYDKVSGPSCASGGTDLCGLAGIAVATYNGYIYVVGGYDGNAYSNAVYYMKPNYANGQTTAWTKSGSTISTAVTELGALTYNGSLYIIGGCNGTTGIGCSAYVGQVQRSQLNASTGAPGIFTNTNNGINGTQQLQLPAAGRSAFGAVLYGGYIYLAGGIDSGNNQLATVVRAKINSSGDIVAATGAAWTATTAVMTQPRRRTVAQAVNGYLYVIGGHNAADATGPPGGASGTTYGDIQIGKIDTSSAGTGDVVGAVTSTSFVKSSTSTLTARWNPAVAFGNGFMFVTGGCTAGPPPASCTTIGTTNESFIVYNADNLGVNNWGGDTEMPASFSLNLPGVAVAVSNGYLYAAGGCTSAGWSIATACGSVGGTAVTQYAQINYDGTLGTWAIGPNLRVSGIDQPRVFGQLVALNGYLYYLGGQTGLNTTQSSITFYSQIGANGLPGAWGTTTKALADTGTGGLALSWQAAITYANRIYILGGLTSGGSYVNTVYVSQALPGGGNITSNWSSTTAFTGGRGFPSAVVVGSFLYIIGGFNGSILGEVQVAAPNTTTGLISSWTATNSLPFPSYAMVGMGANGYIYLITGSNLYVYDYAIFAPVNGNGTIGEWQQAPNKMSIGRNFAAGAYYNGYMYVLGGNSNTGSGIITGADAVQRSGQLSQAMHATYTRYVDFGTDATLRQLYVLGSNAAINGIDIDLWTLKVKTSTNANNAWGQIYTTTLSGLDTGPAYGTPITFQSLDVSGNNTGAARYWSVSFDIDQTQSFSFPDSNQPSITTYDFYFSPGPAKRLRNGKTFVNETQTTLDAHP